MLPLYACICGGGGICVRENREWILDFLPHDLLLLVLQKWKERILSTWSVYATIESELYRCTCHRNGVVVIHFFSSPTRCMVDTNYIHMKRMWHTDERGTWRKAKRSIIPYMRPPLIDLSMISRIVMCMKE